MAIDLCDAEAERLGACQRTGCDRLIRRAGGTAAGAIGRVGTVERVEVQQYLLGHPGGVRGVLRLALGLIGDLPVTVDVGRLPGRFLDLLLGELPLRCGGGVLRRFGTVLAGLVLRLIRLGTGGVALRILIALSLLGVRRGVVGSARHGTARRIGAGRLGGGLVTVLVRLVRLVRLLLVLLLTLLLAGVGVALLPLLLLLLLLLLQGVRVDRFGPTGGEHR